MPELPDITVYVENIAKQVGDHPLNSIHFGSPFFLRSVEPAPSELPGHRLVNTRRIGKRVCLGFDHDLWLVVHLMIAGRFQWKSGNFKPNKTALMTLVFDHGALMVTEAGKKKRASVYVVNSADLSDHNPGGIEPLEIDETQFATALRRNNHTLKRVLTDPRILSGIGNAYSDEILHRAKLSPVLQTQKMSNEQMHALFVATQSQLIEWTERLREEAQGSIPKKVTAFRPEMAVHGKYGEPCPVCQTEVQRIRYASNETNYCPRCQTGGKLLADRSLSRLLKKDWPKTIEALEQSR